MKLLALIAPAGRRIFRHCTVDVAFYRHGTLMRRGREESAEQFRKVTAHAFRFRLCWPEHLSVVWDKDGNEKACERYCPN